MGYLANLEDITKVFNIKKSTAAHILASGRARRLQNQQEVVDNRSGTRQLTAEQANLIAEYIDDAEFDEKALTWEDLQEKAHILIAYELRRASDGNSLTYSSNLF